MIFLPCIPSICRHLVAEERRIGRPGGRKRPTQLDTLASRRKILQPIRKGSAWRRTRAQRFRPPPAIRAQITDPLHAVGYDGSHDHKPRRENDVAVETRVEAVLQLDVISVKVQHEDAIGDQ